jgi:hypothetical protein
MALEGTFQEPIAPFSALSSKVNEKLCEEYRDYRGIGWWNETIEERVRIHTEHSNTKNARDIPIINIKGYTTYDGSFEYPIVGENYYSYDGIGIYGYTKKQAVELFYGLKGLKVSFTSNWNVNWLQRTRVYAYPNTSDPDELLNPDIRFLPTFTSGTYTYYTMYAPETLDSNVKDWVIPTERVCGFKWNNNTIRKKDITYLGWLDSWGSYEDRGWRERGWNTHNFANFTRAGEDNYSINISNHTFPEFYLFADIGAGQARQTTAGDTPVRDNVWTPQSNSFHRATFRYVDAGADKDITGQVWYRFWGGFDVVASSANIHIDLEVERFDFQNPE